MWVLSSLEVSRRAASDSGLPNRLNAMYNFVIILLHRPFYTRHNSSTNLPINDTAIKRCNGSAGRIVALFEVRPASYERPGCADLTTPPALDSCTSAAQVFATFPSRRRRSPFLPQRRTSSRSSTPRAATSRRRPPSCARRRLRAGASCARWARRTSARMRRPTSSRGSSRSGRGRHSRLPTRPATVPSMPRIRRSRNRLPYRRCRHSTRTRTSQRSYCDSAGPRRPPLRLPARMHPSCASSLLCRYPRPLTSPGPADLATAACPARPSPESIARRTVPSPLARIFRTLCADSGHLDDWSLLLHFSQPRGPAGLDRRTSNLAPFPHANASWLLLLCATSPAVPARRRCARELAELRGPRSL